jgi:glutaredoxin 2
MKLYHYVHCPFCIRVRMGLSFLGVVYESVVLPYDDEETPLKLTGQKMLPILEISRGNAINESLDILRKFDPQNILNWSLLLKNKNEIDELINRIGSPVHSLCMPYWIWTPEFDPNSRKYFQDKKESKRGPFKKLIQNKDIYLKDLNNILINDLEENLVPFYKSSSISIVDIMIASHLWGMYIFPEFQFSPPIHHYLQTIKNLTHFDYHQDFWR